MTIPHMPNAGLSPLADIAVQLVGAANVLAALDVEFGAAVNRLAELCAPAGKLDGQLLDVHQWACYELAFCHAELCASRLLIEGGAGGRALDRALGLAFVAEAARSALTRLEGIYLATGLDPALLIPVQTSADMLALRRDAGGAGHLAALGVAVCANEEELGDVALGEQATIARDTFRRFAADVVAPLAQDIHRHDLTVPESLLGPMRKMGVFGLSIPEQYGGFAPAGGDNTPLMIAVTEALSEASLAAAGSLITRPEILARALLAGGTEAQKVQWLPRLANGDPLCAIAITEPDFGSDAAGLQLRGTKTEGGWLLDGAKTWCTFAGKAGVLMVVVRTDPDRTLGHRGLSLLLVEKPSFDGHAFVFQQERGGVVEGRAIPTVGYRGMHSFDLTFDNVFVPDANVIGESEGLGRGFYLTMAGMTGGRIQTAGRALGVMRAAIRAACAYAQERKVFGSALIDFPLTGVKIAQMAARFIACRKLAYAVGRQMDEGGGQMEASLAKLLACRCAELVTREAQQIHGGMGYAEEMVVSRFWLDARVLSIFEGAEETLALKVVARGLIERALALDIATSR